MIDQLEFLLLAAEVVLVPALRVVPVQQVQEQKRCPPCGFPALLLVVVMVVEPLLPISLRLAGLVKPSQRRLAGLVKAWQRRPVPEGWLVRELAHPAAE